MAENKPGNGNTSPFGNEKGATMAEGPSSGAHNFLENPESNAPNKGGRNFLEESRAQDIGPEDTIDQASVPDGGTLPWPKADPTATADGCPDGVAETVKNMPFKNLR